MRRAGVSVDYVCEQCRRSAALCVSDWGYIAALCDDCRRERKNYVELPGRERRESAPPPTDRGAAG
jgi:hypothetical protein